MNFQKMLQGYLRLHYQNLSFGRVPPFDTQSGVWHPHLELSRLRKSPKLSAPLPFIATISIVPDSEDHKPKRNDNSCGVTQQHKINRSVMALSC